MWALPDLIDLLDHLSRVVVINHKSMDIVRVGRIQRLQTPDSGESILLGGETRGGGG